MDNHAFIYDIKSTSDLSSSIRRLTPQQYLVVKCGAKWCGPCHAIQPVFERLARENQTHLVFAHLDVDTCSELSDMLHVRALPTFLAINPHGNIVSRITGANENKLMDMIRGLGS